MRTKKKYIGFISFFLLFVSYDYKRPLRGKTREATYPRDFSQSVASDLTTALQ